MAESKSRAAMPSPVLLTFSACRPHPAPGTPQQCQPALEAQRPSMTHGINWTIASALASRWPSVELNTVHREWVCTCCHEALRTFEIIRLLLLL